MLSRISGDNRMKTLFWISVGLLCGMSGAKAQDQTTIAPRAEEVLRAACQYMAQAPYFGLTAEVWREHINPEGEKLQFTRQVELQVKRPNGLHMNIHSSYVQRQFWYDGKSLTVLDGKRNFYSTAPMPPSLDAALDTIHDEYGIDLPLMDLALSDPYTNAIAKVRKGMYFGLSAAMGFSCHHLAFVQDNIDWQVWIQDGPQPLIRKFVITQKNEPGQPEFTALITQWDMSDRISNAAFAFEAPEGALKIPMRKDVPQQQAAATGTQQESSAGAQTK